MKHLDFNLQNGIILKKTTPIAVYSRHRNTLVITNPPSLIFDDKSPKQRDIIDYVLDKKILTMSEDKMIEVKYASCLNVGYMTNDTFEMKHI